MKHNVSAFNKIRYSLSLLAIFVSMPSVSCSPSIVGNEKIEQAVSSTDQNTKKKTDCESIDAICTQNYDPHVCYLEGTDLNADGYNKCAATLKLKKKACQSGLDYDESKIRCERSKK